MSSKDGDNLCEDLKLKGNKCFSQGNYQDSVDYYSRAINVAPSAVLFSNRAIANIRLKRFFEAEKDCTSALVLNPSFDKAFYRRALALKELNQFKSAKRDLESALRISPNNSEILKEFHELSRLLNKNGKMRISPVQKETASQSSSQLKQIVIKNCNAPSIDADAVDALLADRIVKLVTMRKPVNYSQFENDWRQLASSPMRHKVEYMERISTPALKSIFEFPVDPKMMLEIIEVLSHSNDYSLVCKILQLMTNMPRFDLNVCFFSDEFKVLSSILDNIRKSNLVNQEQVLSLARAFNVEIDH